MKDTAESKFTALFSGSQASPSPRFGKQLSSSMNQITDNKSNEFILQEEEKKFDILGDASAESSDDGMQTRMQNTQEIGSNVDVNINITAFDVNDEEIKQVGKTVNAATFGKG